VVILKNKSIKKYIIYILPVIILVLILTANFWVYGILSLFAPDSIREIKPLMEQYLEQKYNDKMKLDSASRTVSSWTIIGYAHRKNKTSIHFNVYYNKNKDGSYEFYDTYYKEYLKYQIEKRLNEISKQVYKKDFKLGQVLMMKFGKQESEKIELLGIDVSLDECVDIIKYTFTYEVELYGGFDEDKIDFMYELLNNIYENGIIP